VVHQQRFGVDAGHPAAKAVRCGVHRPAHGAGQYAHDGHADLAQRLTRFSSACNARERQIALRPAFGLWATIIVARRGGAGALVPHGEDIATAAHHFGERHDVDVGLGWGGCRCWRRLGQRCGGRSGHRGCRQQAQKSHHAAPFRQLDTM
jgi:hypothetical protein